MHIKGNHRQNEKTTDRMGENICRWCKERETSLQNLQTELMLLNSKKTNNLIKKWTEDLSIHFSKDNKYLYLPNFLSLFSSAQFSPVSQLCPTLCDTMDCSMPGLSVHRQLPEFTQTHVHWVSDAIQPSHPLSSPPPPAFNLSQHRGLFKWVSSSHQVAKGLDFQLQHQSFQWTPKTDLL